MSTIIISNLNECHSEPSLSLEGRSKCSVMLR